MKNWLQIFLIYKSKKIIRIILSIIENNNFEEFHLKEREETSALLHTINAIKDQKKNKKEKSVKKSSSTDSSSNSNAKGETIFLVESKNILKGKPKLII